MHLQMEFRNTCFSQADGSNITVPMQPDNFEPALKRIQARSRRQVMDWSLVLASQGIESRILKEEDGWHLAVAQADFERALQSIKLYRAENRGWRWRQKLPGSDLLFHWGSLFWAVVMICLFVWTTGRLEPAGLMSNTGVSQGHWWRLFTAVTLHADLAHLATNVTTGTILLGLAMARYGAGFAMLAAYLAGAGGNLLGYWLYEQSHRGLGASGMVMGALGLVAIQPFVMRTGKYIAAQIVFRGLFAGLLMLVLMGTSPGTDIIAHAGGFLFGAIFGVLLNFTPRAQTVPVADHVCLLAVPAFVLLTWYLALN